MEIETKVISIETIKPSSPTPKSLQKHQLSFLDQYTLTSFSPLVFFYASNPQIPNSQKSNHLKKSLSETLSIFYPLAGRLVGNLYVDCNDAGAPFSEAEADCDVAELINNPNPKILKNFLPYQETRDIQDVCVAVRATYFRWGGVAVGVLLSHKIADAVSFLFFVNTWSAVARNGGADSMPLPKFDSAAYSPQLDIPGIGLQPATGIMVEEEVVSRIFTFPESEIAALREIYTVGGRRPSRVEALSTFIWTRFVSAAGIRSDPSRICMVHNAVNLRTRADPPLRGYHFGNFVLSSRAEVAAKDGGVEVLLKVREASKAFDAGYVARLKNSEMYLKEVMRAQAQARANKGVVIRFVFTSLCRLPLYEADFGWGRPDRVRHGGLPYKNLALFMDTKSGDGIEALIQLTKQDMEKFEAHLMLKSNLNRAKVEMELVDGRDGR